MRISKVVENKRIGIAIEAQPLKRKYFAYPSKKYAFAIGVGRATLPTVIKEMESLREEVKTRLPFRTKSVEEEWHQDPVRTLFFGKPLAHENDKMNNTFDSEGNINGKCRLSSENIIKIIESHCRNYMPPSATDEHRNEIRKIEEEMLATRSSSNFLVDFVCHHIIDEKIQNPEILLEDILSMKVVSMIEKTINDHLRESEGRGKVSINRSVALVGRFEPLPSARNAKFSDLFFRLLEFGIPVVYITSNQIAIQSMFRWVQTLLKLMGKEKIDLGLLTFVCCNEQDEMKFLSSSSPFFSIILDSRRQIVDLFQSFDNIVGISSHTSSLLFNSSDINPNDYTDQFYSDNFGPLVVIICEKKGSKRYDYVHGLYEEFFKSQDVSHDFYALVPYNEAIEMTIQSMLSLCSASQSNPTFNAIIHMPEVVEDMDKFLEPLCPWIVDELKPQYLNLNMGTAQLAYDYLEGLFSRTNIPGISLYIEKYQFYYKIYPELGEVIGINPPYYPQKPNILYPVVFPVSMSVYCATYADTYLQDSHFMENPSYSTITDNQYYKLLLAETSMNHFRSYLTLVASYLSESLEINPKQGVGQASVLWGIQNIPVGFHVVLRMDAQCLACDICSNNSYDTLGFYLLPFIMTTAHDRYVLSIHPDNDKLAKILELLHIKFDLHTEEKFLELMKFDSTVYSIVRPINHLSFKFPLISQFMSAIFPFGHIKSSMSMDKKIFQTMHKSKKWLKMRHSPNDESKYGVYD